VKLGGVEVIGVRGPLEVVLRLDRRPALPQPGRPVDFHPDYDARRGRPCRGSAEPEWRPLRAARRGAIPTAVVDTGRMATQEDVRRIALALPRTTEEEGSFRFLVERKGFAWVWLERVEPKKARIPNPEVVAIRVGHELEKEALIEMDPAAFFTEPHYDGFPAILVRLAAVDTGLLGKLLTDAWRLQAPKRLVREFDARG
jgi:hypothetical protein